MSDQPSQSRESSGARKRKILAVLAEERVSISTRAPLARWQIEKIHDRLADRIIKALDAET